MNAIAPIPQQMSDVGLIRAVREKAAFAEAEIEAAYRFRDGSAVRDWHLGRADQATIELLGLINGSLHQDAWDRIGECAATLDTVEAEDMLPSFLRPAHGGPQG